MTNTSRPTVGTTYTRRDALDWKDANGVLHTHKTTILFRVTEITTVGFKATAVELLEETERPPFVTGHTTGHTMAWFGWEAALKRGDVTIQTA